MLVTSVHYQLEHRRVQQLSDCYMRADGRTDRQGEADRHICSTFIFERT
jgi:hypothetical protein